MATKETRREAGEGGGAKAGGKSGKSEAARRARRSSAGPHAGAGLPVPPPRLKDSINDTVRGEAERSSSASRTRTRCRSSRRSCSTSASAKRSSSRRRSTRSSTSWRRSPASAGAKKAKKSIANFGLRQGQEIGAAVTLRGARMWEFLDRFITVAIPRIRDFRGLGTKSFDGRGNYSLGVKEQMIFPEINYDQIEPIHGMDITFVTSTNEGRSGVRAAARAGHAVPRRKKRRAGRAGSGPRRPRPC